MNVIDTSKFVVSEHANYSILDYDGVNIIEIDNFIENFDEFKEFILSIPVEKNKSAGVEINQNHGFAPGYHATIMYFFDDLKKYILKKIESVYGEKLEVIKFQTNIFDTGLDCPYCAVQPHIDPWRYAMNIWFNDDSDCIGGTGFYKHKETGYNYFVDNIDPRDSSKIWHSLNSPFETQKSRMCSFDYESVNDEWEFQMVSEMKKNRIVIYPGNLFHIVYTKKDWFSEKKRISLAGFAI